MPTYLSRLHLTRHMPPPVAGGGMSHLPPAHPSPPRPTQLPVISPCHMPHTSAHAVSPLASTARTHPHRAPHSYPRHDDATGHTHRRMTYRHTPRPHAHPSTTPHTATRATPVPHAARIGARRIATRLDRTHPPPPRPPAPLSAGKATATARDGGGDLPYALAAVGQAFGPACETGQRWSHAPHAPHSYP